MLNQNLSSKSTSLWIATTAQTKLPFLQNGMHVDVVVIGGGLVGLTVATLLKAEGKTVALFWKRGI